jgi:glyoxylase-like metal-dependent hydrolase (beta-lactamase superfamily II)
VIDLHRLEIPLGNRIVTIVILESKGELLIVDSAIAGTAKEAVTSFLARSGRTEKDVRYLVVSHADFDHVGGNAELRDVLPAARFVCHAADRAHIEDAERMVAERYGEFGGEHGMPSDSEVDRYVLSVTHTAPIDECVAPGDELAVGDARLRVLHLPGHSDGHVALYHEESGLAVIGDAVLGSALPTVDGGSAFPPTYRNVDDYLGSIDALRLLAPATMVTGHFPVLRGAEVTAFLDTSRDFVERLDASIWKALGAAELSTPAVVDEAGMEVGDWPAEGNGLAVYPVVGHLERLEERGLVRCRRDDDGLARWSR